MKNLLSTSNSYYKFSNFFFIRFHLVTKERVYKLEADTKDKKVEWIDCIKICQEYAMEQEKERTIFSIIKYYPLK